MKEMIYKNHEDHPENIELLYGGKYKGYKYFILSIANRHPCAYVELPDDHIWYGVDYDEIDLNCHGGVTYSRDYLGTKYKLVPGDCGRWVIGWDYAHSGDAIGDSDYGKKWTTEEIHNEVIRAIEELKDMKVGE